MLPEWLKWDPTVWPPASEGATSTAPATDWLQVVGYRIPLDRDHAELQEYIKTAAFAVNHHQHTHTCKKGGRQGGHHDCRMNFDLPLVPSTCRLADCTFAVRRDHGLLVPCVPSLMLAYPANHLMQLTCEGSRFLRQAKLWEDAMEDPSNATSHGVKASTWMVAMQTCLACLTSLTQYNVLYCNSHCNLSTHQSHIYAYMLVHCIGCRGAQSCLCRGGCCYAVRVLHQVQH